MTHLLLRSERGQTMAEYSVVLSVITVIVIGAFAALATGVAGQIARIAGYVVT
jgi:Flp pilus assembly pilin Flp